MRKFITQKSVKINKKQNRLHLQNKNNFDFWTNLNEMNMHDVATAAAAELISFTLLFVLHANESNSGPNLQIPFNKIGTKKTQGKKNK